MRDDCKKIREVKMKKILIVSKSRNLVPMSLKSNLEKLGFWVDYSVLALDQMHKIEDDTAAIVMNIEEDTAESKGEIVFLRDQAVEVDAKIFLLGVKDDVDRVAELIPDHIIERKVYRPINVQELTSDISRFVENNEKDEKKTIMVVDDSGSMLLSVKSWLEDKYKIIMANSGTMAIKYLSIEKTDLVLLDYEMPVISGKQVLEMIRSEEDFRDTPVIFLTSKNDKESVMEVMSLKPEGYLLKTMTPAQIRAETDAFFANRERR